MRRKSGSYIIKKVAGESYKAYVPASLPPEPALELDKLSGLLEKAVFALSELDTVAKSIPIHPYLLLPAINYNIYLDFP